MELSYGRELKVYSAVFYKKLVKCFKNVRKQNANEATVVLIEPPRDKLELI